MQADSPSRTAMGAAFLRALHLVVDEQPWVFEDHLAAALLPGYLRRYLARLGSLPPGWLRTFRQRRSALGRMRAQILVRSRFTEDALAESRRDGAGQYLILAAGLDTFAWRQPDDPSLPVLEVDHPATQAWKRRTLARQQRPQPDNLTFRPVDFETQSLAEVLEPEPAPRFVSWLGTSYYLSEGAITATLSTLAERCAPGSRLALDYWQQLPPGFDAAILWGTRLATALQLEPMRCFFSPAQLATLAERSGWRVREQLPAAGQNARYLAGRRDGLEVPGFAHLVQLER